MRLRIGLWLVSAVVTVAGLGAQEVIQLPFTAGAGTESYPEKQYFSETWKTEVVTNVTHPSLTLYKPASGTSNGVGVVICPGGGFMALSINSEGVDVAKWLAEKGVTAFVLKYRLAHTGDDGTAEFAHMWSSDREKLQNVLHKAVPLSIEDGRAAMRYVRAHAGDWNLSPDKIGMVGFSAGGTVTAAAALRYEPAGRPAFAAPIYGASSMLNGLQVPADAPPLFVAAATDDNLGLAPDSVALYQKWVAAKKPAELHMYAQGGHGFGMRKKGLPSDEWIDRFWEWLQEEGVVAK